MQSAYVRSTDKKTESYHPYYFQTLQDSWDKICDSIGAMAGFTLISCEVSFLYFLGETALSWRCKNETGILSSCAKVIAGLDSQFAFFFFIPLFIF